MRLLSSILQPWQPPGGILSAGSLPPTGIQVCRSSATTTFDHQQKIQNPIPNHIVIRFIYHLLASKSADLLPQLLLTINRKSQIQSQIILPPDFFTTQNVRPCLLFHIRTRLATTATKAQSILTGRSLIVLHIVHIIVVTCCQCCHLLSMLSPTRNWTFKGFYLEGGQFAFLWT